MKKEKVTVEETLTEEAPDIPVIGNLQPSSEDWPADQDPNKINNELDESEFTKEELNTLKEVDDSDEPDPEPVKYEPKKSEIKLLTYSFTDEELKALALELARKIQEAAEVEKQKKAVVSEYKMKQDLIASEIGLLSNKVSSGQMIRETNCLIKWHFPNDGVKTFIRTDTMDSWEERMTQDEWNRIQPTLFND
jgi:hypothetical protein